MGSILKRGKRIKNKRSEEEDRISSLPSSLIGHILSFLPTKDAVKTSLLSTKWQYHWTSITNFYFYYRTPYEMRRDNCDQSVKSFINFVYRVLLQSDSDMHKFRLRCENICDNSHLSQWVSIAILRHVHEVDISLVNEHVMLPHELWNCNTLVVLKLDGVFALNVPNMVCLPSLKILHLDQIEFSDDDSTERLVSSCPALEDLALLKCFWKNINVLNISALALKSLTIDSDLYDDSTFNYMYKIVFNTPNLQYLKYSDHVVAEGYSMNNFNSLVKADIKLVLTGEFGRGDSFNSDNVKELLRGISKVQQLYFGATIEALQMCSLPNFDHLTYLELGELYYDKAGWELLPELLEHAPQLETLVCQELIYEGDCDGFTEHEFGWQMPRTVPSCLLFCLKVIEIRDVSGRSDELKMLKYFLKNAKVLKRLIIHSDWGKKSKICNILLRVPRGSKTCRLEVC